MENEASEHEREGGCFCGAVRYAVTLPSKWCAHCHCEMCRRAHGAAWVTWFGMPAGQFRIARGQEHLVRFASSDTGRRSFCSRCGTMMLFENPARWPDEVHVTLASLEGPLDRAPSANTYWDHRARWADDQHLLPKRGGDSGTARIDEA